MEQLQVMVERVLHLLSLEQLLLMLAVGVEEHYILLQLLLLVA
jgi:hypothetical protein